VADTIKNSTEGLSWYGTGAYEYGKKLSTHCHSCNSFRETSQRTTLPLLTQLTGKYVNRQTCFEFQVEFYSLGVNKHFFFLPKRQFSECYALDCSFTVLLFSSTLSRLNVRNCIKGAPSTRLLLSGFVFTIVCTVLMLCCISFALVLLSHVNMWCALVIEKKKRLTYYEEKLTHCQERLTTLDWTLWLY